MPENQTSEQSTASHTLALLRRFDQRLDQLTELFVRQQDLIGRLERDMREGFSILQRDLREMKSDMVLMENRIVSAVAADHFISARLNDHEDRLESLEGQRPSP